MINNLIGLGYIAGLVGFQYYVALKYSDADQLNDYFKRSDELR